MKEKEKSPRRRVAITLDMDWGFRRHQDTYAGCHAYAEEAGWDCFIHPAPERILKAKGGANAFDGIIARAGTVLAEAAMDSGVPIVNVWMNSPVKNIPNVFPDTRASGKLAAEHLLGRGFRNFGFLGFQRDVDTGNQWLGFSDAIRKEGMGCTQLRCSRANLEGTAPAWEPFISRLEAWIDSWKTPIGIFVTQDLYCRYLIDVCRAKGLYVSQDVAIVGCGNEAIICEAPAPTLTSIDISYSRVGYLAAKLLDDLMAGGKAPGKPILVAPSELVPRQSTDVFAASDPMVSRALRFIAENSHERIEVKEVVCAVATNRRSLERRFRESIGRTIADEITRLRLERAKRRIVETDAPLKYIATDAGFRNADHFYKVFTRVEGITPSRFREERQKMLPEA
ncbi:substrate-binding domain-containing protein [Akkermansiaceae bacterium]|nr:substrate-binding domain-containing protein [Akkermansiaceae bacterium]